MIESREVAFFGGWHRRVVGAGDHAWGNPQLRNFEVVPSAACGLILPKDGPWRQRGVPYWVINTGAANCAVKSPDVGNPTVWTVGAGTVSMFILGGTGESWRFKPIGFVQFGSVIPALRMSIEIVSSVANANLLQLAIARGYDGTQPIAVTCRVRAGVAIGTTHPANRSFTTGNTVSGVSWFAGSTARLILEPSALIGGWGGNGGRGGIPGTGSATGINGQNGGQALRAEIPLRITCNGQILGGGGGGGGGGSSSTNTAIKGGGGGGGRGVNMALGGSGAIIGSAGGGATSPAQPGAPGGAFTAGGRGPGPSPPDPPDPYAFMSGLGVSGGGNGGSGGNPGSIGGGIGFNGTAASPGAGGGTGGQPGAAISYLPAAGAPVIESGGGNILGSTVSEAS